MQESVNFRAPWSISLTLTTIFTVLLFIWIPLTILFDSGLKDPRALLVGIGVLAVCLALMGLAMFTQLIRMYSVSRNYLVIRRFGPDTKVPLADLESLEIDPNAMNRTYVMTNGGLFAFSGKACRNKRLGSYEAYATDKKRSVVLRFPGRVLVVTPSDPQAFVKAVEKLSQH